MRMRMRMRIGVRVSVGLVLRQAAALGRRLGLLHVDEHRRRKSLGRGDVGLHKIHGPVEVLDQHIPI